MQFGKILASAWNKSASVNNPTSGFSATGIIPFNRNAIPDYAFLTSGNPDNGSELHVAATIQHDDIRDDTSNNKSTLVLPASAQKQVTAKIVTPMKSPGKILDLVSPIPTIEKTASVRQWSRKIAEVLNSTEKIQNLKKNNQKKVYKEAGN